MQGTEPESSRMPDVLEKKKAAAQQRMADAISFG